MTTTNNYTFAVGQIQNLEINSQGIVTPRLHDLEPLENTLLGVLYPDIKIAVVNVPVEPLDDYQEAMVENALATIQWEGVRYKLMGASGSAKKGKFYFVDEQHIRKIAERFQHWPQAAIVYGGILVSPCKVMIECTETSVLTVPDHVLGTNDSRGWIRRSLFAQLRDKHDQQLVANEIHRLLRERYGTVPEWDVVDEHEKQELRELAKRKAHHKALPDDRFYQFRMAFHTTQAKGAFKIMEDDVADALEADFVLPDSAVKPGLKIPAVVVAPKMEAVYLGLGELTLLLSGGWTLFANFAELAPGSALEFLTGERGMKMARILFAVSIIPIGLSHLVYADVTAGYVPHYLPYRLGWAYLTGAGQIASGLGVLFGVLPRIAAWAEAGQITLYTLLVWGGEIVAAPKTRLAWTAFFISWIFGAAAWVVAQNVPPRISKRPASS